MDFLERIFSLSPDGGSGATELLLLGVIVCALAAVVLHFRGTLQRKLDWGQSGLAPFCRTVRKG